MVEHGGNALVRARNRAVHALMREQDRALGSGCIASGLQGPLKLRELREGREAIERRDEDGDVMRHRAIRSL